MAKNFLNDADVNALLDQQRRCRMSSTRPE